MKVLSESFEFWQSAGWFAGLLLLLSVVSWFWLLSLYLSSIRVHSEQACMRLKLPTGYRKAKQFSHS